jgi:hypothetical protein
MPQCKKITRDWAALFAGWYVAQLMEQQISKYIKKFLAMKTSSFLATLEFYF